MVPNAFLNLLRAKRTNPIVARCLHEITQGQVKYEGPTVLPLSRAKDLYSIRAQINSELNGGAIEGFDELLVELGSMGSPCQVKLLSVECPSKWFILFTDESELTLYGILESPKRKPVWFDPVTGYES